MGKLCERFLHQCLYSQTCDMSLGVQVGPKGVHVEKDNVFNSQAYAAGAPAITIGNDPGAASSSSASTGTAYSGAVAQAPTASTAQTGQNAASSSSSAAANPSGMAQAPSASTYQNNQNNAGSSNSAVNPGATAQAPTASPYQNNQNTQNTYSATNQATSSSASGAGTHLPHPLSLSHPDDIAHTLPFVIDDRCSY